MVLRNKLEEAVVMTDEEVKALEDELQSLRGELEGLKQEKETLTGELSSRDARVSEVEQIVALRDSDIVALRQTVAELDEQVGSLNQSLNQAVSSYKALVIQANPGIIEDLIGGDSIEQVNESVEKAKTLVSRVRKELEEEASKTKVPAGAPQRTPPDLSALSPREKIQYAIGGKR